MFKSNKIKLVGLFLLIAMALALLIYVPRTLGVADNSDFNRTMKAFGLSSASGIKFWSADTQYKLSDPGTAVQYFKRIFWPAHNPAHYYSTQFIFVKLALFLNAAFASFTHRDPGEFNLAFQTVQYILLYAAAFFLFFKEKWKTHRFADLAGKALLAFFFLDSGYLVYFNSFYGESTTLIFLLIAFVLLLYLEKGKTSLFVYLGALLSLFLFSGSKSANFPSALLLAVPVLYQAMRKEDRRKKIAIGVSVAVMLVASYGYVKNSPDWMKKVTTFQSVFFGVLYEHPAPEQAVQELGLPPELAKLETVNAYAPRALNPYNLYEPPFESLFFDHTGKLEVFTYYLIHPEQFAKKLDESAEAALPLRPTYLANLQLPEDQADLRFDFRLNLWERLRKQISGFASVFVGMVFLLYTASWISLLRIKADPYRLLLRLALLGAAAGQFIVPLVSNGHADLQKHMFLFNVHFDLLIFLLFFDHLGVKSKTFRRVGIASTAVLVGLCFYPSRPETVTLGRMDGKPIKWYVLEREGDWTKVIAKKALYRSAYDERSNDYTEASIQAGLDAKVDVWFTADERKLIRQAEYPALCNEVNWQQAEEGDRPHYWFSPIKYVSQDSERAYRKSYSASLTLPSVDDAERLFRKSKTASVLPGGYWLSTPYYGSTDKARVVSPDYQVYHRKVDTVLGVRPVMWVRGK
ncbi:glycan biosynthesis hexose transferase WsfD [Gorillibacterium sp. sgz500922]|uniref:glycan biosynthesis hexose transferase WsfD n=1 Tax=Gorillibacterium sp. sgz500922 TaxID=3446694 RepID=UPI003F672F0C